MRGPILLISTVLIFSITSTSSSQIGNAFIGSTQGFLNTVFCQQRNACFISGTLKLADQETEEYYSVKPREKQAYGQETYTVFFTRDAKTKAVTRAGIRYIPAQDYTEDGTFAASFFSFASGVPLQALDSQDLISGCLFAIRGRTAYFFLDASARLPFGNAGESLVVLVDGGSFAANWFDGASSTARVVRNKDCKR